MKYTSMKRLVYILMKETTDDMIMTEDILVESLYNDIMTDNVFWYLFNNDHKILDELYKEGKIKSNSPYAYVKDII